MKKILLFLMSFGILFCIPATPTNAQLSSYIGANHSYSVTLRGNGDAYVMARLVINNFDSDSTTSFSFQSPDGVTLRDVTVLQQKIEDKCLKWDYSRTETCLSYGPADYNTSYYYGGTSEYKTLNVAQSDTTYQFDLAWPVESNQNSAVIVLYRTSDYTKKTFGGYNYNITTLKTPQSTSQINLAIDVDADQYLKGSDSSVGYRTQTAGSAESADLLKSAVSNAAIDSAVSGIGYYGAINKTAKGLAPNETYSTTGMFAKSWWGIYWWYVLIALVIMALIIITIILITRKINRNKSAIKPDGIKSNPSLFNATNMLTAFAGAVLVGFIIFLNEQYNFIYSFGYYNSGFGYLLYVLAIGIIGLAGPLIVSLKQGWKGFVITFLATAIWLIVIFAILAVFTNTNDEIYPVMDKVVEQAVSTDGAEVSR